MTTAVIVQARVGSARLPGKVLEQIGPRTVLEEVLRRCWAIGGIDVVVCAIPETEDNEVLVPLAERARTPVVRGSERDVLARYQQAAENVGADVIVRITSDCPLIDPMLCDAVRQVHLATAVDYAANNMPAGFPHGLDCEVFTMDALRRASEIAVDAEDREHVTPWLRRSPEISRSAVVGPGGRAKKARWTLDFQEDLDFIRAVYANLEVDAPWWKLLSEIEERPELAAINADRLVAR